MIHRLAWSLATLLAFTLGDTAQLTAQVQLASRAPRFVRVSPVTRRLVDASHATILKREMSLSLDRSSLADALDEISQTAGINLIYSRDLLPPDTPVTLQAAAISLGAALTAVLFDTGLDVVISSNGEMALMKKAPLSPVARAPTGSVSGRVTDAKTEAPISGATVVIERTTLSATTDNDGHYRIAGVALGTYTVRARFIGYSSGAVSVTVSADQEATADIALEKSVQKLDEVVTTGTVVPTEVRALPTPISVITESDIALQRPRTVKDVFRQAVPTAVAWDFPQAPSQTPYAVRGANTLSPGNGQMKVFVDGIEAAWPTYAQVDVTSIGRIEVIRGPEAATIYGPDAIGGVVQIFTKRGDPSSTRTHVEGRAALGVIQTPYADYNGALRQNYAGSVNGGLTSGSYSFGASYWHTGDYIPFGKQSGPSVYGGVHLARGIITFDASGRYYAETEDGGFSPAFLESGFSYFSKPLYWVLETKNQTYGAQIRVAPTSWWQSMVTVGVDRYISDINQTQPRLTTPSDTLLFIYSTTRAKTSIGFNTSLRGALSGGVSGSLTAGFDHYSLPVSQYTTSSALNTRGTIQVDAGGTISAAQSVTNNTGYFAQIQLSFLDALFLTGGLRAEQNSDFGATLSTPVSPRAGLSYVREVGGTTLKLRGSYGRAIRAPSPGQKFASVSPAIVSLGNPILGPERQRGLDAGVDAVFGTRGSLSVTYYDQTADDLIQLVDVQAEPVRTVQYQNVGRVKNTGLEVEGSLLLGPVQLKGQYGYARARIDQLAPNYAGDLQIGDQSLATPRHTAGGSITFSPASTTTVAAGLTYVGNWTEYDYLAYYKCLGQTGPCRNATFGLNRDYFITYSGFVKANASVSQRLTSVVSGFVSIDNLTNNQAVELTNTAPVTGRITTVGLQFQY